MSKNHLANQASDITAEASAWIAQLETGDLTPADVDAFREWMHRSPRHAAEVRRLARLSEELNVLSELAPALREAAEHYRPVTRSIRGGRFSALFSPSRLGGLAVTATVLIVTLLVLLRDQLVPQFPSELETPIGGYLEQTLADGSVVKLNTDSRIRIAFNYKQRHIFLHRGEVFFQVAHNPERPFVVHANGKIIRAVGTAFAVRLDTVWQESAADLEVTVTEGRVELRAQSPTVMQDTPEHAVHDKDKGGVVADGGEQSPSTRVPKELPLVQTILDAGQHLVLSAQEPEPKINTVTEEEIRRSLSWREGLFDFSETPLDQVVREFDRHTRLSIEVADPTLRDRKFSGIFPTGNINALLETLETAYGIEVTYVDANTVQLGRRPPQG